MTIEDYDEVYSLWMSCVGMELNNLDDSKEVDIFITQRFVLNVENKVLPENWLIVQ